MTKSCGVSRDVFSPVTQPGISQLQTSADSFRRGIQSRSVCLCGLIRQGGNRRLHLEVADIFRKYGMEYRRKHPLPPSHLKVMHALEVCRTAYLGGHIEKCDHCGFQRNAYNSCRNRHCPKCQALVKAKWLEDRKAELLPVDYFHVVFTLPHELNPVILQNKTVLLNMLFKAVSETLLEFGRNNLGGKIGFTTILHSWDQKLFDHFHLHCLIPAGALSLDEKSWIYTPKNFLFPVKALSKVFRGKFLDFLKSAYKNEQLTFSGNSSYLQARREFQQLIDQLYGKKWVVYAKESFSNPEDALEYLSRYTHKVAISNERIKNLEEGKVSFSYKDRKSADVQKEIKLEVEEFIRRFLLHVLPDGFMRIRHFGFLANRCKKKCLNRCRQLLGLASPLFKPKARTPREMMLELTGKDISRCPCCKKGTLKAIAEISPAYSKDYYQTHITYWDTS